MEPPKGYRDTFSRPHLVRENEVAGNTLAQIQGVIAGSQQQTVSLQRQLHGMRTDGRSTLEQQSEVIERIGRSNRGIEDMGTQITKLQGLMEFNRECIRYIDWLRGGVTL